MTHTSNLLLETLSAEVETEPQALRRRRRHRRSAMHGKCNANFKWGVS